MRLVPFILVCGYLAFGFMGASCYLFYFGPGERHGRVRRLILTVLVFPVALFNKRVNTWLENKVL